MPDSIARKASLDPDVMRPPMAEWPSGQQWARIHADRADLWALLHKWDARGALRPATDLCWEEARGDFRAPRDTASSI
eukprot:4815337-Pyramimonas_sp.AAC.1